MSGKRKYLSGSQKKKIKKIKLEKSLQGRRTLDEFGLSVNKSNYVSVDIRFEVRTERDETENQIENVQGAESVESSVTKIDNMKQNAGDSNLKTINSTVSDMSEDENLLANDDSNKNETPESLEINSDIILTNDPGFWKTINQRERDYIILKGPPKNLSTFPDDSLKRKFPSEVLNKRLQNGEKILRDCLIWSELKCGLFCFPCCLFRANCVDATNSSTSKLVIEGNGLNDNWRKLQEKITSNYIKWKECKNRLISKKGIDASFEKEMLNEKEKWRNIPKY